MGWLDYHLHAFRFPGANGKRAVEVGIPDEESNHPILPGWKVGIADHFIRPGVVALYKYDFGDGWEHEIVLEGVLLSEPRQKYPRCLRKTAEAFPVINISWKSFVSRSIRNTLSPLTGSRGMPRTITLLIRGASIRTRCASAIPRGDGQRHSRREEPDDP